MICCYTIHTIRIPCNYLYVSLYVVMQAPVMKGRNLILVICPPRGPFVAAVCSFMLPALFGIFWKPSFLFSKMSIRNSVALQGVKKLTKL